MTLGPDDFKELPPEIAKLDKVLAELQDCDLGAWDQDFVDDLTDRIAEGELKHITPRQWEQIERMRGQYL